MPPRCGPGSGSATGRPLRARFRHQRRQFLRDFDLEVERPLAVDKTEITTYCIAPRGESRKARTLRIRQYEEFFNPSGLATPDDTVIFEDCQAANQSGAVKWHQGYMRGLSARVVQVFDSVKAISAYPITLHA